VSLRHPYYRDTGRLTVGGWPLIIRTAGPDDHTPTIMSADQEVLRCDLCWLNIAHTTALHAEVRREVAS